MCLIGQPLTLTLASLLLLWIQFSCYLSASAETAAAPDLVRKASPVRPLIYAHLPRQRFWTLCGSGWSSLLHESWRYYVPKASKVR